MSKEQKKEIAIAFLDALGRCDIETLSNLSTDDMTWWIMPGNKFSGIHEKEDYLLKLPRLLDDASGPLKLTYHEFTGEGDRLAVVATGDMPMNDGRHYRNIYHFLIHFRDGKVAKGQEFTDSLHINQIFGPPDD